jgi:hypothetical protein
MSILSDITLNVALTHTSPILCSTLGITLLKRRINLLFSAIRVHLNMHCCFS